MPGYGAIAYRGNGPRLYKLWFYIKALPGLWRAMDYHGRFPRLYELLFYIRFLPVMIWYGMPKVRGSVQQMKNAGGVFPRRNILRGVARSNDVTH